MTQGHRAHGLLQKRASERSLPDAPASALALPGDEAGPAGGAAAHKEDAAEAAAVVLSAAEKKARERARRKSALEARKILFEHVRLNRVHCRVTYQVRALSLLTSGCVHFKASFMRANLGLTELAWCALASLAWWLQWQRVLPILAFSRLAEPWVLPLAGGCSF